MAMLARYLPGDRYDSLTDSLLHQWSKPGAQYYRDRRPEPVTFSDPSRCRHWPKLQPNPGVGSHIR